MSDDGRQGWTFWRAFTLVLFCGIVAFWVWAFSPLAPVGHPDRLDDDAFAEAAEPICAAAVAEVTATVPLAIEASDVFVRAEHIETATDIFAEMHAELVAMAPPAGTHDGDLIRRWLDDWGIFLGDRYAQAERNRNGVDESFVVTAVDGHQVTSAIDIFADINEMESCISPSDV